MRARLLVLISMFMFISCGDSDHKQNPQDYVYTQPETTADGWETASLESVGIDPEPLKALMNILLNNEDHLVHGILIIRHNKLVFEEYFSGLTHPTWGETPVKFYRERLHVTSSVTKSFTATLLGIAIDHGFISNVDEKVLDFYPELADLNNGYKQDISLRHLVTMSSGLEWDEWTLPLNDPNNDLIRFLTLVIDTNVDPVRLFLERNVVEIPGTVFNYNGGNTNILGNIIQRESGLRLDEFADEYLFEPLGIEDSEWYLLRPDFVYASGDLALRPRDMAKFGQLFLQKGLWNGERIVSEEWVTRSATPVFFLTNSERIDYSYSFGWWPCSPAYGEGTFAAAGWGGQIILVLPENDMVVVFTGGSYWEPPLMTSHEMMVNYILPSIQ